VGGQPCLQRTVVGTRAKEADLECCQTTTRARGEETPSEPESSGDDEDEAGEDEEEGR
jgi:hypothetical protein